MTHRVPDTVVDLGEGAELVIADGDVLSSWDVSGFKMCCPPDAEDRAPGHARLFLLEGNLTEVKSLEGKPAAQRTYEMWNDRGAEFKGYMETSKELSECMGRADRLDYDSDKWNGRGEMQGYTHDFFEHGRRRPPLVYTDDPEAPEAFLLVGGDMVITRDGIA